jgi:RND superfamily putative drug exporter
MRLLGDRNWWLPAWLDRILPRLDVEGGAGLPEPDYEPRPDAVPGVEPEPALEPA